MQNIYLLSAMLGAGALLVQVVLGLIAGDIEAGVAGGAEDGLNLLSARSIAAGAMLFGATGMWLASRGVPAVLTAPVAMVAGAAAAAGTAYVTRRLMRLESDGSLRLDNAIGQAGTVYLPVPPRREGAGKVQFTLQGRTVELRALADEPSVIPTGAAVIVVAVVDDDTVEVTPTPQIEGL
ncbi:MAG TPA: hypothetical protein VMN60_08110 [Longimicrobiales bacterium]|nr:hypothetical protein [Longimicrobiales bacterium]